MLGCCRLHLGFLHLTVSREIKLASSIRVMVGWKK
jgi:hypothetical protein